MVQAETVEDDRADQGVGGDAPVRGIGGDHRGGRRHFDSAIRMHYNDRKLKKVRDSDWSAGHIAAHDVTLDEVREAILEHPYWSVPGRDTTTLIYGRTYAGRYLFVVAIAEGEEAFIVTARDMTDAEKKTFHRKAR